MDEAHWLYDHTTKHDITTLQIEGVSSVQHVSSVQQRHDTAICGNIVIPFS